MVFVASTSIRLGGHAFLSDEKVRSFSKIILFSLTIHIEPGNLYDGVCDSILMQDVSGLHPSPTTYFKDEWTIW